MQASDKTKQRGWEGKKKKKKERGEGCCLWVPVVLSTVFACLLERPQGKNGDSNRNRSEKQRWTTITNKLVAVRKTGAKSQVMPVKSHTIRPRRKRVGAKTQTRGTED